VSGASNPAARYARPLQSGHGLKERWSIPSPSAFDSHAEDYEAELARGLRLGGESKEFFALGRLAYLRRWWSRTGRAEPRRILDYGCGVGDVTSSLAETFPEAEVRGVDPSARSIERARKERSGPRVSFGVLEGFTVPGPPADLVHLNGVVHHVPPGERDRLFPALHAAVSPGGVVAVFENNPWNVGARLVMARISFDRDAVLVTAPALRRGLAGAGLAVRQTRFLFWFPAPLRALRPLERWLTRIPFGAQYAVLAERPR
jgi:SAM-dependent methyltransferase